MKTQLALRYYLYRRTLAQLQALQKRRYNAHEHGGLCQLFWEVHLELYGPTDEGMFCKQTEVITAYKQTFPHHVSPTGQILAEHFSWYWWDDLDSASRIAFMRLVLSITEKSLPQ